MEKILGHHFWQNRWYHGFSMKNTQPRYVYTSSAYEGQSSVFIIDITNKKMNFSHDNRIFEQKFLFRPLKEFFY